MEIYVSTDIEADGPIPGPHSMLSFASAAYMADKILVDTYYANLETLPGASGHPETMRWWEGHPLHGLDYRPDHRFKISLILMSLLTVFSAAYNNLAPLASD